MPTAEIVSVGTELLLGQIVDSDAAELGRVLAACGVDHRCRQTVGDNLPRLVDALRTALARADIVFTIGGLGPTQDDLTREGIAEALGRPLVVDEEIVGRLRARFEERGWPWVEAQTRQAMKPEGAHIIDNPNGTAPGLACRVDGKTVIAMPGPPAEFIPMLQGPVQKLLRAMAPVGVIHSRTLRVVGLGESLVEDRLRDLLESHTPSVATYAKPGEVHVRLTAKADSVEEAEAVIAPVRHEILERLGTLVYGEDDQTLEQAVVERLRALGHTVSLAESCTGGGLGARITSVPGSSEVFLGGVVAYTNRVKQNLLGVDAETLIDHGAVSAECAREMALGVLARLGSTWSLSITGIAGPGGGSAEKPVGLVYIGLAGQGGVEAVEHRFAGSREIIRQRSGQAALAMLLAKLN